MVLRKLVDCLSGIWYTYTRVVARVSKKTSTFTAPEQAYSNQSWMVWPRAHTAPANGVPQSSAGRNVLIMLSATHACHRDLSLCNCSLKCLKLPGPMLGVSRLIACCVISTCLPFAVSAILVVLRCCGRMYEAPASTID